MEIFHIAAECYPVAKFGGLADLLGILAKYENSSAHLVKVIIPCYDNNFRKENEFTCVFHGIVKLGYFSFPFNVVKVETNKLGFELYLIEIPDLFDRKEIYGYEDDTERFLTFQIAALDWLMSRKIVPKIINCHDHQTALIPFFILYADEYAKLKKVTTVITIHNSLYQGQIKFDKLYYLPEFDLSKIIFLEWNDKINSLAAAIKCANKIILVLPNDENKINNFDLESLFDQFRFKTNQIVIDFKTLNVHIEQIKDINTIQKTGIYIVDAWENICKQYIDFII